MIGGFLSLQRPLRARGTLVYRILLSASLACACAGTTPSEGGPPAPSVSISANPTGVSEGQSSELTWSSTGATFCTANGGWSGVQDTSGTVHVSPPATTTYVLACSGDGGTGADSVTVTFSATPPPTITFTATPSGIAAGEASTLDWTTSGDTLCLASGGWSGTKAASGSEIVSPTTTTDYSLSCGGIGGTTTRSVTVTVGAPSPPTVSLTPSPASVSAGQSSTLTWYANDATTCEGTGGTFSGARPTSGSELVWPASTTLYVLTCSGPGGAGVDSAMVAVAAGQYVYPLEMGSTGRHLVDQNGRPFLLVGDAAWSLIAQPSDNDVDTYLANRAQLGFNTLMVELIEHRFADNAPANYYGEAPFTGNVFTTPNEAYFAHADRVIQAAADHGITVLLDPAYVGYECGSDGWCAEMKAASVADMTEWGKFLGSRYKDFDNIIWLIGGDTDPSPVKDKLKAVVAGIRQFDTRHLFTTHNQNPSLAIDPWPGESWQTLNSYYTYSTSSYEDALRSYHVTPPMAFYYLEGVYENEGASRQQLRAQHYWSVLAGGIGQVYGNCPLWYFGSSAGSMFCEGTVWTGQLNSPGALDMYRFQRLFAGRHWDKLVPDEAHEAVTGGLGSYGTDDYVVAAYASDGSSIIAYLPTSRQVTVSGSRLVGDTMVVWWYNPATGAATNIGMFPTGDPQTVMPPSSGDWVLVLDSPSFGFPPPGT